MAVLAVLAVFVGETVEGLNSETRVSEIRVVVLETEKEDAFLVLALIFGDFLTALLSEPTASQSLFLFF